MTAASPPAPADHSQLSLRERKKIKTREAIRAATYALVEVQGYEATTIDQIADRAEVSPSTVFRYFPTKEDIVLTDEYDPIMLEELLARPDEPLWDTVRYVARKALGLGQEEPEVTRLRARLVVEVPAVHSRMMEIMSATGRMVCRAIGERSGWDPDSLEVRVFTMSLIAGLHQISIYWAENGYPEDKETLVDRALDVMEHGLPRKNR